MLLHEIKKEESTSQQLQKMKDCHANVK